MTVCGHRTCSTPVNRAHGSIYCSDKCLRAEYAARRNERRIYSLYEISAMDRNEKANGYVVRRAEVGVWVGEHVLVMESVLGTRLPPGSQVHHVNGVRDDNSPENLELWLKHHPRGQRVSCPNCAWPNLETVGRSQ